MEEETHTDSHTRMGRKGRRGREGKGRETDREGATSTGSLPRWLPRLKLGQPEAMSQKLLLGFLHRSRSPCTWAILCCVSRP